MGPHGAKRRKAAKSTGSTMPGALKYCSHTARGKCALGANNYVSEKLSFAVALAKSYQKVEYNLVLYVLAPTAVHHHNGNKRDFCWSYSTGGLVAQQELELELIFSRCLWERG